MFSTVYPRCLNKACILSESTVQPMLGRFANSALCTQTLRGLAQRQRLKERRHQDREWRETAPGQRAEMGGTRTDGSRRERRQAREGADRLRQQDKCKTAVGCYVGAYVIKAGKAMFVLPV